MRRRSLITFIILNVLISLGVAFAVITLYNSQNPSSAQVDVITVEVRITNTTNPNATVPVRIITATPLPGSIGLLPTGVIDTTPGAPPPPDVTSDVTAVSGALGADAALQGTATALPPHCILHVIEAGDTPFGVAEKYGANGFDLMEVNGLTEQTAGNLQIGDVLIVPLEGCSLTAAQVAASRPTQEVATEVTAETTAESTEAAVEVVRPTLTLPPTAVSAQLQITDVIGAGDLSKEEIYIRNNGATINLQGWTLSDNNSNTYTFAERSLFSQASISLATRVGEDTARILFWNRSEPLFKQPGAVLTLKDRNGTVQSTFRVPAPVNLP